MLAAVPSIIYGFWGLVVLVPFIDKLEPGLHSALGFIPLFGPASPIGISVFTAGLVLTVMILPIISALSRDLFLTVPTGAQGRRGGARCDAVGGHPGNRPADNRVGRRAPPWCSGSGGRSARRSPSRS